MDEREHVSSLPPVSSVPDLRPFAENGLGVAAFEGDAMIGFLCCVSPFKNAFRSTKATGVFSPMGAHGAAGDRGSIYARMYREAGEKWARAGASSHAICLYAHDKEARRQLFQYGFGARCVDAIRGMDDIKVSPCPGFEFYELAPDEFSKLLPLNHSLDAHMAASPIFILRPSHTEESFVEDAIKSHSMFFVAAYGDRIVAFIRAARGGETFVRDAQGYAHVDGAFCAPEHRGKGLPQTLLNTLIQKLRDQGYTRLGVDFESLNPAAYGFWLKYFAAYTHSVVRRIDENAVYRACSN